MITNILEKLIANPEPCPIYKFTQTELVYDGVTYMTYTILYKIGE